MGILNFPEVICSNNRLTIQWNENLSSNLCTLAKYGIAFIGTGIILSKIKRKIKEKKKRYVIIKDNDEFH